ncbi:MAG: hypothetical protein IPM60_08930 [Rhodospirillales bacterium]|nr:hypothetical protein [Rhodospirillales bacterium]
MVTYFGLFIAFIALLVALIGGTHAVDAAGRRRLAISGWLAGTFGSVGLAAALAGAYQADVARNDAVSEARALRESHDELRADVQTLRAQRDGVRADADRQRLRAEGLDAEVAAAKEKLDVARRNEMYLRLQIERQTESGAADGERELERVAEESLDLDVEPTWVFDKRLYSGGTLELKGFDCSVLIDYGEERAFVRLRPQRSKTILLMSPGPQPFTLSLTRSSGARCKGDFAIYQPESSPIAVLAEEIEEAVPPAPQGTEVPTAAAPSIQDEAEPASSAPAEASARVEPPPLDAAPPAPPLAAAPPAAEAATAPPSESIAPPPDVAVASPQETAAAPAVEGAGAEAPELTAAPAPRTGGLPYPPPPIFRGPRERRREPQHRRHHCRRGCGAGRRRCRGCGR